MKRRGFTLVELIVVMAITSILGTIVFNYLNQSSRQDQQLQSKATVQTSLSLAIDRVNRVLRSTTSVISADNVSLKVLAYSNTGDAAPSQIYFYITNNQVRYDVIPASGTPPNYTYNPGDAKTFTLLGKVTNSTSTPLFQYYDQSNNPLTSPPTLADVHAIGFLPKALDTSNALTAPIADETYVTLRNFKTNL